MFYLQVNHIEAKMIKREDGFTLVELMVSMVIFVLTIAAATSIFVPILTQFKQQSKIAETNIEGMVGLEILRRDIEVAGFGLPWTLQSGLTTATYLEASGATSGTIPAPNTYNDGNPNLNPPRAIFADPDVTDLGGSDYLVIKSTAVATNDAARKWTDVIGTAGGGKTVKTWGNPYDDIETGDRVIVIVPARGETTQRVLVNNGAAFSTDFKAAFDDAFSPGIANEVFLIYGIKPPGTPVVEPRMPFNRADYYIRRVAGTTIPDRCATGVAATNDTGVLTKSVINHANGERGSGIALLDCVADFQVVFGMDTDDNGDIDSWSSVIDGLDAETIRNQVKEVRVYILAHEGQYDNSYTYPNASFVLNDPDVGINVIDYDLTLIDRYERYRWKGYTLAVKPRNLR